MLGRSRAFTKWVMALFDAAGIVAAVEAAVHLRVAFNPWFHHQFHPETAHLYLPPLAVLVPLWLVVSHLVGSYDITRRTGPWCVCVTVAKGSSAGLLALVLYWYLFSSGTRECSRSLSMLLAGTSLVILSFWRLAAIRVLGLLQRRGAVRENFAVIGDADRARDVVSAMENIRSVSCRLQGFIVSSVPPVPAAMSSRVIVDTGGPLAVRAAEPMPTRVLGHVEHLSFIINAHHLDRVIVCAGVLSGEELAFCAEVCERMNVRLNHLPDVGAAGEQRLRLTCIDGIPLIEVHPANLSRWDRATKRAIDVTLVLMAMPLLLPVFAAAAIAIKLDSAGPVFYTGLRVGKGGRFFPFIKFRSMVAGADRHIARLEDRNEKDGHIFKIKDDPRITRVGRFVRRFSIDELPQLINVLLGHMSLVGPRPLPIDTFRLDGESAKFGYWSRQRHSVLPGMTGFWQVRGRSDLDFKQMIGLDLYYIRHWSLWLDLVILFLTLPAVLKRRGAY